MKPLLLEQAEIRRSNRLQKIAAAAVIAGAMTALNWYDPSLSYVLTAPRAQEMTLNITHHKTTTTSTLEQELDCRIYGALSSEVAFHLEQTARRIKGSALLDNLESLTIVPETIKTHYSGYATPFRGVTIKETARWDTIIHEFAHNYSFSLGDDFWDEWKALSKPHVDHPHMWWVGALKNRVLGSKSDDGYPRNGIVTGYGSTNIHEDLAEFVEECYGNMDQLEDVHPDHRDLYVKKIDLLERWRFLTADVAESARESVSYQHPENIRRLLTPHLEDLPSPGVVSLHSYGAVLYDKDGVSIETAAVRGPGAIFISINRPNKSPIRYHANRDYDGSFSRMDMPAYIFDALKEKGYIDNNSFGFKRERAAGKTREQVSESTGVPIDLIGGPVEWVEADDGSRGQHYYIKWSDYNAALDKRIKQ